MTSEHNTVAVELAAGIVTAYVAGNPVTPDRLPELIRTAHSAVLALFAPPEPEAPPELVPAVPVRKSVSADFITCLDDGKRFKSLKRHLATLGMTPAEYRERWGLPSSYPMVAPNYSEKRSALAKASGLGTH